MMFPGTTLFGCSLRFSKSSDSVMVCVFATSFSADRNWLEGTATDASCNAFAPTYNIRGGPTACNAPVDVMFDGGENLCIGRSDAMDKEKSSAMFVDDYCPLMVFGVVVFFRRRSLLSEL